VQLISLNQPQETNFRGNHIRAYIPVMPEIWECKKRLPRQHRILHISNYKVMKQDHYQQDLLELALSGMVEVHGSGWSRMGVPTGRISLRQANEKLSRAICCLGLMYSHQRGRTLSGRMWQAPLHGCYVLSERGTNVFSCPGIIEVDSFRLNALVQDPAALSELKQTCETLQAEAHRFWRTATRQLASELGLQLSKRLTPRHLFQARFDLLRQHLDFVGAKELHRWRSYVEILGNVLRRYLRR
jgi:hypothetical protein